MKNTLIKRTITPIMILLPVILTISCRLEIPIREMAQAKSTITRAIEVKAEKYAPEELRLAQEALFESHKYISAEDSDKSAWKAKDSIYQAETAIAKSLPLLARDSLENAKSEYSEAESLYAEKFAPEEYSAAGESLKLAEERSSENAYWDSHLASVESSRQSSAAKAKALASLPGLKSEVDRIQMETDELRRIGGDKFAADEVAALDKKLIKADNALGRNSLKEAAETITGSDELLASANLKTYGALAKHSLANAETALANAKESEHAEEYSAEIQNAEKLIDESKAHIENNAFQNSIEKSDEAVIILNTIAIDMEKRAEEKRLALEAQKKDDLDKETAREEEDETDYIQPSVKEYVVQFNPKKRDCLWRISQRVYSDARLWPLIYVANRDMIKDPDLIFPGQKFKIPPVPRKKADGEDKTPEKEAKREERTEIKDDSTEE